MYMYWETLQAWISNESVTELSQNVSMSYLIICCQIVSKTVSGTAALNWSLEQKHGTELEPKYFVWNSCMERKYETDSWNRAGMEILCLEQLHGTELERKYFVWNSCMEQSWKGNTLSWTDAWNRAGKEILCLEQLHGTEVWNSCVE